MTAEEGKFAAAFSMGDPHGIGPEVLLRALALAPDLGVIRPLVFGDPLYLRSLEADLGLSGVLDHCRIVPCGDFTYPPRWGTVSAAAGKFAVRSLSMAVQYCRDKGIPLLVTPPINKESAHLSGEFPAGQTEFIASFFPGHRPVMAFFSDRMHVVLATVHIPLSQVPDQLEKGELIRRTELFHQALRRLGIEHPRIAMCGLNPHASEGGLFGDEERRVVAPAVSELNRRLGEGSVQGPFPADTLFRRVVDGEFDGVTALYHDQGLIPLKLLAFDRAVNVSLGLPLLRTSPDHGTAFDIAGKGRADPGSMLAAIHWGLRLLGRPLAAASTARAAGEHP